MPEPAGSLDHLTILGYAETRDFHRPGGGDQKVRNVEHRVQGPKVAKESADALDYQDRERVRVQAELDDELKARGVIITIEGVDEKFPLKLESLDRMSSHRKAEKQPMWIVLSVHPATGESPETVLVWVSDDYRTRFLKLFEDYLIKETEKGNPHNQGLVANIGRIRATVLRDLWQSSGEPPMSGIHWWELWLRPEDDAVPLLDAYAQPNRLQVLTRRLQLDARTIVWIRAKWDDLYGLPFSAVPLAEIRRPQFVDTVEDLESDDQDELLGDLANRLVPAVVDAPAVCMLDTGVRRTHVLISESLSDDDLHSVVGQPAGDLDGHGTKMAGVALLGSVDDGLLSGGDLLLAHRLESVKLLPDKGKEPHDPESYGLVTAEAVALPEAKSSRKRAFCMPITCPPDVVGEPSLWSAAVDALAVGTDIGRSDDGISLLGIPDPEAARLIIVSAGNVREPYDLDYRNRCDTEAIQDPAQAWNALTVGAYTDLIETPADPSFAGWNVVGARGDISPHSRTGVAVSRRWPVKPDLCLEGGNILSNGAGDFHNAHPLLSVRTIDYRSDVAISSANATSAATAQAGRLAAMVMARYPSLLARERSRTACPCRRMDSGYAHRDRCGQQQDGAARCPETLRVGRTN